MSVYPEDFDVFVNPQPNEKMKTKDHADIHTDANEALKAIQETLGIVPQDTYATVASRLDALELQIAGYAEAEVAPLVDFAQENFDPAVETETFTLQHTPLSGSVAVYLDGILLRDPDDYTVTGADIELVVAGQDGDQFAVVYAYDGS